MLPAALSPRCSAYLAALLGALLTVLTALTPTEASASDVVHTVRKRQNLGMIARRYHTTPQAILNANGLKTDAKIYPGQRLKIRETAEHKKWRAYLDAREGKKKKKKKKKTAKK